MTRASDTVGRFFQYQAAALQSSVDATRDIIEHALTKGVEAETALAELLASLLPRRFDSRKGFLIDSAGKQSHELDLVVVDRDVIARLFDFRAFELVPVEAASAGVEVKTTLDKRELDDTFTRFQQIQEMRFFEEHVVRTRSRPESASVVATSTSRPELAIFAYDASISNDAVWSAYARHPDLAHVKICILNQGVIAHIVGSPLGPLGLRWIKPVENEQQAFAGRVLSQFLYQLFLPSLFEQTKGTRFYSAYLQGQSDYLEVK